MQEVPANVTYDNTKNSKNKRRKSIYNRPYDFHGRNRTQSYQAE